MLDGFDRWLVKKFTEHKRNDPGKPWAPPAFSDFPNDPSSRALMEQGPLTEADTHQNADLDVIKRCAIVKQNPGVEAIGLCTVFDNEHIPLPPKWTVSNWANAYRSSEYRSRVQVIISKDKKRNV